MVTAQNEYNTHVTNYFFNLSRGSLTVLLNDVSHLARKNKSFRASLLPLCA